MSRAAFDELVAPHLGELRLHCYRLLGSLTDAEDALQETLLAAWRGLPAFEERSSARTWLYRIATNRCLNAIRDNARRPRTAPVPPFTPPEPTRHGEVSWLQPYPDALFDQPATEPGPEARYQTREAVELAFVEALQRMPPRQAAALVLCDVLGFSMSEVATMLDTTAVAVKGALARARSTVDKRVRVQAAGAGDRELSRRFAAAFVADDVEAVVALLTDDAWLSMPPAPHQYQGPAAIAGFLAASAAGRAGRRFRLEPTWANAQPAFVCSLDGAPAGVIVLTPAGDRIAAITRFLDPGPGWFTR